MDSFSNDTLNLNELPDYIQANYTPIVKSYIKVVIFNLIIFSILIILGSLAALYFLLKNESMVLKGIIFGVICFFLILMNVFSLITFKRKSYAFRQQDVIYRSGILTISHEIVPYNRLQHVVLKQGWLSRSLGLATIHCYTAASSANEIAIPGLEKKHAERIKDMLINRINNIELAEKVEFISDNEIDSLEQISDNKQDLKDE